MADSSYEKQAYLLWSDDNLRRFNARQPTTSYKENFLSFLELAKKKLDKKALEQTAYGYYCFERREFKNRPAKKRPVWTFTKFDKTAYCDLVQKLLFDPQDLEIRARLLYRSERLYLRTCPEEKLPAWYFVPLDLEYYISKVKSEILNSKSLAESIYAASAPPTKRRRTSSCSPVSSETDADAENPEPVSGFDKQTPDEPVASLVLDTDSLDGLTQSTQTGLDLLAEAASHSEPTAPPPSAPPKAAVKTDDTFNDLDAYLASFAGELSDADRHRRLIIPLTFSPNTDRPLLQIFKIGESRCRLVTKPEIEEEISRVWNILSDFKQNPQKYISKEKFHIVFEHLAKTWLCTFRATKDLSKVPLSEHRVAHENVFTIPITHHPGSATSHLAIYLAYRAGLIKKVRNYDRCFVNFFVYRITGHQGCYAAPLDFRVLLAGAHNESVSVAYSSDLGKFLCEDLVKQFQQTIEPNGAFADLVSLPFYPKSQLKTPPEVPINSWLSTRLDEIAQQAPCLKFDKHNSIDKKRYARLAAARALWVTDRAFYAAIDPKHSLPHHTSVFNEDFYLGVVYKREEAERRASLISKAQRNADDRNNLSDHLVEFVEVPLQPPLPAEPTPVPAPPLPAEPAPVSDSVPVTEQPPSAEKPPASNPLSVALQQDALDLSASTPADKRPPIILTIRIPQSSLEPPAGEKALAEIREAERRQAQSRKDQQQHLVCAAQQQQQTKTPPKPKRSERKKKTLTFASQLH